MIETLHEEWGDYFHLGDVPDMWERISVCGEYGSTMSPAVDASASAPLIIDDLEEQVAYVLVDCACSKHSRLGHERYSRHEGKLAVRIRLTEDDDMTSSKGLRHAFNSVEPYVRKVPGFLLGILPCTLWTAVAILTDRAGRRGVTFSPISSFNFMRTS